MHTNLIKLTLGFKANIILNINISIMQYHKQLHVKKNQEFQITYIQNRIQIVHKIIGIFQVVVYSNKHNISFIFRNFKT